MRARREQAIPDAEALAAAAASGVPLSNRMMSRALAPDVSSPSDAAEVDAERTADRIMRSADGSTGGSAGRVSGGPGGSSGGGALPRAVAETLGTAGQSLNSSTRSFMEGRFGRDFGGVRVHTDGQAGRSAGQVGAAAYTVGTDIVFGAGRYDPGSGSGQRLLAHELAHVAQPAGRGAALSRFHLPHGTDADHQYDETTDIADTYAAMLATIKGIIAASVASGSAVDMDKFVQNAGGYTAGSKIDDALSHESSVKVTSMLSPRYVLTRRAGLLDMRHFCQLLYIAQFATTAFQINGNRGATNKGREHELTSESESKFGPEDTTSNAIGAYTGSRLPGYPDADGMFAQIKASIDRCDPVDFASLSPASKQKVIHFYGDLVSDPAGELVPANQNQTAAPPVLDIPEFAGADRSFPFAVDQDDPDGKTIEGEAFDGGSKALKDDDGVRSFVKSQKHDVIRALPAAEKVRLVGLLFEGWLSDDDIAAIESIYGDAVPAERAQIRGSIRLDDIFTNAQRARMQKLFST